MYPSIAYSNTNIWKRHKTEHVKTAEQRNGTNWVQSFQRTIAFSRNISQQLIGMSRNFKVVTRMFLFSFIYV